MWHLRQRCPSHQADLSGPGACLFPLWGVWGVVPARFLQKSRRLDVKEFEGFSVACASPRFYDATAFGWCMCRGQCAS